jgi:lysyl-tRNA synthetase class 2
MSEAAARERLRAVRLEKLEALRARGVNPYPYSYGRSHAAAEVAAREEELSRGETEVSVAGRLVALRAHGKTTFGHVLDGSGTIQFYARRDELGEEAYERLGLYELGDWVGVVGTVFRTRTGELTVRARKIDILSKALRPLPEKWHGLQDKEIRFRRRYLDLVANPNVRDTFVTRSRMIRSIRSYLDDQGFLEVETPVLQPVYGGASARPFVTSHNALDMDLYMRIADELYLKRLLVGGFEKVYEFCKDFRNEGIDRTHNPEFTMLELYASFWDYTDMMFTVEKIFERLIEEVLGGPEVTFGEHRIDLSPPWERIRFFDAIGEATGRDLRGADREEVAARAREAGIGVDATGGKGKILDEIFSQACQPRFIQPVLVFDYPKELSPLAKDHRSEPGLVERFEPIVAGLELGNAFSELNDPLEQRRRFEAQMALRRAGDEEAQVLDEDFLLALEHGMPPAGGLGLGIDRMAMLLTNSASIREVVLFPHLRPETGRGSGASGGGGRGKAGEGSEEAPERGASGEAPSS